MGKTLTSILLVGAAIAVNVIPGVGQAISGAIVGALGGTFASVGIAALVAPALVLGLTVAGIQAGFSLLGLGPNAPKPETTETALRTERPPRVSAYGFRRLYGASALYDTAPNGSAVDVWAIHDGELTEILQIYLNDDPVTISGGFAQAGEDGRYGSGNIQVITTTGSVPGPGLPAVASLLPDRWTADHRGDGVVLLATIAKAVRQKDFITVYPNGVPTASMVAKWQKCPDPSAADPSDEASWTWTENPVRHLMHYKLKREGVDYATKIAPTIEFWRDAAAVCDEAVPLKAGGTEPRYRGCVAHKHTDPHRAVTGAILASFDGWIAPRADGALIVYAGKYVEPTVSIGPDQIIAFDWEGVGVDDDKAINEIVCAYVSDQHDYSTVDATAWVDEDDIAARGAVLSENFDPQVPSHGQVRRLAKRKIARTNAFPRMTITTNVAGRIVRGHRYIDVDLTEAGTIWYRGPVEVIGLTRNLATGGVTMLCVPADPNIDAWNPATEEGEPAPVGNRTALAPVEPPEITAAVIVTEVVSQGIVETGNGARVQITASAPNREDLTWYARWRAQGSTLWNESEYSDIDPGTSVTLITGFVPTGDPIEVQVAYGVGDGRISPWSETAVAS